MKVFAKWWKWKSSSFLFHSYHDWNKAQVLLWWLHLTGISSIILYSQCPEFWQKHENTIWRKRARLASWLGAHLDHSEQLSIKFRSKEPLWKNAKNFIYVSLKKIFLYCCLCMHVCNLQTKRTGIWSQETLLSVDVERSGAHCTPASTICWADVRSGE